MFERAIKLLEYDKILKQLQNHAASSLGIEKIEQLKPESDINRVQDMVDETEEAFQVLRVRGHLPFGGITNVRPFLKKSADW